LENIQKIIGKFLNLSIKNRLLVGFGVLITLLLGMGGYFLLEMQNVRSSQHKITSSMEILSFSEEAEAKIVSAELLALSWLQPVLEEKAALMEYVNSKDQAQQRVLLNKFNELSKQINEVGDEISSVVTAEEVKAKIKAIKLIQTQIHNNALKVFNKYNDEGGFGEKTQLHVEEFSASVNELLIEIRKFQGIVNERVALVNAAIIQAISDTESQVNSSLKTSQTASNIVVMIMLVSALIALALSTIIYRSITQPLNSANELAQRIAGLDLSSHGSNRGNLSERTDEISVLMTNLYNMRNALRVLVSNVQKTGDVLSESSTALTNSAEHVNKVSTEQLSSAGQSVDIAKQLQDATQNIAGHASSASEHAQQADDLVKKCVLTDVAKTNEAMQQVSSEMQSTRERINGLSESAEKIGDIVTVINSIAEQTNLLALNAAIEAARAGEQGRGFAVVADEVRSLAERTSEATSTISGMINNVQTQVKDASQSMELSESSVSSGVEAVAEIVNSLKSIETLNHQLKNVNQDVAGGTGGQRDSVSQILDNLESSKSTSADLNEDANTINSQAVSLNEIINDINQEVAKFKV